MKTHDLTKEIFPTSFFLIYCRLFLSNYLTLTYNAVDSAIVGRYIGDLALAAVGTSNPLMTFSLLFINGICLGASILIGKAYGAKDKGSPAPPDSERPCRRSPGVPCSFSRADYVCAAHPASSSSPSGYLNGSSALREDHHGGALFPFCYGYFSTVLRAMGDSQTTLFILAVSAGLNVLGDYLFVVVFGWGIVECCRKHGPLRIALILVLFAFSCKFYG